MSLLTAGRNLRGEEHAAEQQEENFTWSPPAAPPVIIFVNFSSKFNTLVSQIRKRIPLCVFLFILLSVIR